MALKDDIADIFASAQGECVQVKELRGWTVECLRDNRGQALAWYYAHKAQALESRKRTRALYGRPCKCKQGLSGKCAACHERKKRKPKSRP